jgi:hypothetical protein
VESGVFFDGIPVGHPGDIIADGAFKTARRNPLLDMVG